MSDLLDCVPELEQRQDSVTDQLYDLYMIANKMGMRDAADIIKERIKDAPLRFGCTAKSTEFQRKKIASTGAW